MTTRDRLLRFIDELRGEYPQWRQRDFIAHFRRAIPGYAEGVWTATMPLNAGPSRLRPDQAAHLWELLQRHSAESGVDLGHVLVCLDLALNPNTIEDHFASWAGDLGLHALTNYLNRSDIAIGGPDALSHANRADLLADLDGEVLARRLWPGRELDAIFAYYDDEPPSDPDAARPSPHFSRRFELFLNDHDLLDDDGQVRHDAASSRGLIHRHTTRYIFWEQMKNHLARLRPGRMARLAAEPTFSDTPELRAEIAWVVEQFVDFLREGLAAERRGSGGE